MNSLENLNNWANEPIIYGGDGAYSIAFSPSTAVAQSVSILADTPFVSPSGINITEMNSCPRDMLFIVNLSSLAFPASINWGTLPEGVTAESGGTNIFQLRGYFDNTFWDIIKTPTITTDDQVTSFSFTSTITYPDPSNIADDLTKTWTTSVTVTATPDLSTPTEFAFVKGSPGTIAGTTQIIRSGSGTFTMTVTPSTTSAVALMSSTGSGGTSSFNSITKVLTITGTVAQVNDHLNHLVLTTPSTFQDNFILTYNQLRPSGSTASVTQTLTPVEAFAISTYTFAEDTAFPLQYAVLDSSTTATSFSISVAQTTPLPTGSTGYFLVNGSNVGTTWATSNTKANINSANVVYNPPIDYAGNLTLTVNQSKVDNGNTVIQSNNVPVNIAISSVNNEVINMIPRSYTANTKNMIFSSTTPQIQDGPDTGQTYTITLSSALGVMGNSFANVANVYSFTGNKTACNAQFANIIFLPTKGVSSNGTFTYTQTRGNVSQVNTTVALTGTNAQPNTTPVFIGTLGTSTWSATDEQKYYLTSANIAVIGGGGGCGNTANAIGGAGGGGGIAFANNVSLSTTYTFSVGAGGTNPGGYGGGSSCSTLGISVTGGNPGLSGNSSPSSASAGGASGTPPTSRAGGNGGLINNIGSGGSGGGASTAGTNLSISNVAKGGNGVVVNGVEYCAGGWGGRFTNNFKPYTPLYNAGCGGTIGYIGGTGGFERTGRQGVIIITFNP